MKLHNVKFIHKQVVSCHVMVVEKQLMGKCLYTEVCQLLKLNIHWDLRKFIEYDELCFEEYYYKILWLKQIFKKRKTFFKSNDAQMWKILLIDNCCMYAKCVNGLSQETMTYLTTL